VASRATIGREPPLLVFLWDYPGFYEGLTGNVARGGGLIKGSSAGGGTNKEDVVEFRQGDALLVIDVFDDFDHDDAEQLLGSFRARGAAMASAIAMAREAGVPVIYVNDDRDRWDSDAPALACDAANGSGGEIIRQLLPRPGDHLLLKHRYSAFDHTALELLLEAKSTERIVVVGAATEGCVVQTALDAREHGLKATILAEACATTDEEREETALRYAQDVGGIHVRRPPSPTASTQQ
jgi:nicotinamidase-related amidase